MTREQRRWEVRMMQHRCGRCGEKLAPEYAKKCCRACLDETAETVRKVYWRKRGFVPPVRGERPPNIAPLETPPAPPIRHAGGRPPLGNESPRWRELERSHGRCSVCGLLEPHECLDALSSLATSRPGPREAGLYTKKHPRGQ